ncbi:peptidoglycan DD-metalloendopeptidase family protein [Halomonas icarae]|uniref:Peptidoglycan DD-metalloendopeptidase family protein n=1 Tax=Halomonas icarae TaxID=2691040 RepID=A0A7X5ALL1_9GAMM|nr:peptidoglycan DD-metalloendopeptidase family protein [Halomonas icarae]MDR5903134.1 peptidoglycan DD-metalloendopeptidase family protein [Halomonas icarae]NAW12886.1 peptidoglycan DD-metalloendopeptidase family protein [Halomonas icarae]
MLRVLHSLPRAHKLLLLPVATMVTVLGTQKIVTTYHDIQRDSRSLETVVIPLDAEATSRLPSLNLQRGPVGDAIEMANQALDATRQRVPITQLKVSEVVDLELVDKANADSAEAAPPLLARLNDGTTPPGERPPLMAKNPASSSLNEQAITVATEITAPDAKTLNRGAVHIATLIGTIGSGMLDHDGSLVADATSYEDIPESELALLDDGPVLLEREIAARDPYVPEWETYTVEPGDAFTRMAQEHLGLGYSEALALLEQLPDRDMLERWQVGSRLDYKLDEDGKLISLRMMRNARSGFVAERDGGAFEVASIEYTGEAAQRLFAGTVSGSFTRSAQATGLSSAEVSRLVHVLGKKLDFRRDTRRGDRFQVLVESDVINGESFDPRVLAVQYEGERASLTLVRNSADNNFYTPEGESLDPAFNRYPFEGRYRLSSNFNPRRKHPVTGRISPHKGTDFAMPIGTPITAPSDGVVESVRSHYAAGRYIVIRHDNGYRTRYLHLSRPLVSRGERVTMGQRIALSGNTGRSTGPHLHYEVLVNDNQVDAMQVKLPENKSLSGDRLVAFQREAEPLLAALQSGEVGPVVASTGERDAKQESNEG